MFTPIFILLCGREQFILILIIGKNEEITHFNENSLQHITSKVLFYKFGTQHFQRQQ